jgi:hypothetical protein
MRNRDMRFVPEWIRRYEDYLSMANFRPRKLVNGLRCLLAPGNRGRLGYRPLFYMIETGKVCRLRCEFCCQGNWDPAVHGRRTFLRYDDFLVLLRKIEDYALVLDLFKHGEPLLNPDLPRIIRAARAAGVRCRVNSALNCDLTVDAVRDLAGSGLYKMICAIDGTTQQVYERYRVGGSLSLALDNASRLLAARRGRYPRMTYRMLVFEWNRHQVDEARQRAAAMGFDEFRADPGMCLIEGGPHLWEPRQNRWIPIPWHLESVFPVPARVPAARNGQRCRSLFRTMVLDADGRALACCHSSRAEWRQESLLTASLDAVWNSGGYMKTREYALNLHQERTSVLPSCRACVWL